MESNNKLITQPFLNNLQKLGMFVQSYCHADEMIHLTFPSRYSGIKFLDFCLNHDIWFDIEGNKEGDTKLSFHDSNLKRVKRLISKWVKEYGTIDNDPDLVLMEYEDLINKLGFLVVDIMGKEINVEHCCDKGLSSSISPESMPRLSLMMDLIMTLLPRELGGVNISFKNTSSTLSFDLEDNIIG